MERKREWGGGSGGGGRGELRGRGNNCIDKHKQDMLH